MKINRWHFSQFGACDMCEMELDNYYGEYVLLADVIKWLQDNKHKEVSKAMKEAFSLKIQEKEMHIATADRCVMCGNPVPEGQQVCGLCKHKTDLEETIACRYYVPAWAGNKTSGSQPDFCLKHRVVLCGKCVKSCKEQNK